MQLISVYDADGAFFRSVVEDQALSLLEHRAAYINPKSRKVKLHLTVDHSAAKCLLAPRYPIVAPKTYRVERLGEYRLYQHHNERCAGYGVIG